MSRTLGFVLTFLAAGVLVTVLGCGGGSSGGSSTGGGSTVEFKSPVLNNGDSFQHVFNKAGTFHYYCMFHGTATSGMHATIVVTAGGTPNKTQSNIVAIALSDFNIDVGDTIRWTNMTAMQHTVQSAE